MKTNKITKVELIKDVANNLENVSHKTTKEVIETFIEQMKENLVKKNTIQIIGFGTFSVSLTNERKGINPQTKKPITIPARHALKFKVSAPLKEEINKK